MALGFLVVFSEPGAKVTLDEFQDWYDNEHVPLRLNHLPSFLSGARYSAADSVTPSWLAMYDIDDTSTFQHENYTRLRANRSAREASLIQRLKLLDRRTYELVDDTGESSLTSSLKASNPTTFVVTHDLSFSGVMNEDAVGALKDWTKATLSRLDGAPGWVRTRTYKCIDNVKTGTKVNDGVEKQDVPPFFAVHEFISPSAAYSSEFVASFGGVQIAEDRKWQLYRAYPCIAQGKIAA